MQARPAEIGAPLWGEGAACNRAEWNGLVEEERAAMPQASPLSAISHWRSGIAAMYHDVKPSVSGSSTGLAAADEPEDAVAGGRESRCGRSLVPEGKERLNGSKSAGSAASKA